MNLQPQMIVAVIVAALAPIAAKYGISNDVLASFIGGCVGLAAAAYAGWQTSHQKIVAAVQASSTEQVVTVSPAIKAAVPDAVLAPVKSATVLVPTPGASPAAPKL